MQTGKIGRQFRPQLKDFTGDGVLDRQYMGMERLPAKGFEGGLGRFGQQGGLGAEPRSVDVIAQERMADRGQMDPNLVGAAGFEPAGEQACHRLARGVRRCRAGLLSSRHNARALANE